MRNELTSRTRPPPEQDLVSRIRRDPTALEQFYRAHLDDVIAFHSRHADGPHDLADLVADTFVSAIASADGFDPERGRPIAWLLGIARNVYRNRLRHAAHEHAALREIMGHRLIDDGDVDRLEERIDAERRAQQLLGHIGALTAREREMVELVDLAGLSVTEAARMLRLPTGAARIRLHRARTRLRRLHSTHPEARET